MITLLRWKKALTRILNVTKVITYINKSHGLGVKMKTKVNGEKIFSINVVGGKNRKMFLRICEDQSFVVVLFDNFSFFRVQTFFVRFFSSNIGS